MAKIDYNQYIIAIGASAGGLEAISKFFDHTPADAVSYVLIQHLSADFQSQMAQILKRHSKLEIIEVTDHIQIETNKVYLIPSAKFMVIRGRKLILTDKKDKLPPHLTIDHFFSSLAEDCGEKAIAVLLSGTGRDGSKGIQAIKGLGGMVIVQDPETAAFGEMLISAIDTGCADFVLNPVEMPQVIEDYVNEGMKQFPLGNANDLIGEGILTGIFNLIKKNSAFDFTDYKRPTILRRIKRRLLQLNFSHAEAYYEFLQSHPAEVEVLANDFLISVTSFFRDPEAFKVLEDTVIPSIVARTTDNEVIKIWVPGCATGQEAFSLAILVKEYLNRIQQNRIVKIYATDISKSALAIASKGIYPQNIDENLSETRLKSFFTRVGPTYKINHEIRKMIVFAEHDLVRNVPYCNVDLVSCRNLLIYMSLDLQERAFSMMHFGLKMSGYLFLGPSENAEVLKSDFTQVSTKWNIYQNNKAGRPVKFNTFSSPVMGNVTTTMEVSKKETSPAIKLASSDELNLAILQESGFNGVCTDENLTVIRSFGDTTAYLKNENFNFNLNDLIPGNISIVFKAAAHKALKTKQRMELSGLKFKDYATSSVRLVNIVIKPFTINRLKGSCLLILFIDNTSRPEGLNMVEETEFDQLAKEHLVSLEQELAESRINLEEANERSVASNENLQSYNEEQQSANEEMQSANEELQSVNEELHTVNKEYHATNAQLQDRNEQLNNSKKYIEEIFNTIHDPLVILDKELRVIRATDGFYQTFKVTEEETEGNFLYNLGNKQWNIPVLRHQLEKILPEQGSFKAFEVNHIFNVIGHKIMRLTARQFDTYTNETLILLAIHDLTDKRKVEEGLAEVERLLAESKERLHFAIESAGIGSWDFNLLTKELIWDNRCKELYGLHTEDTVDYSVFLNLIHADDRMSTDNAVNKALKGINNGEFNVEYRSVGMHDQKVRWIKSKGKAYFNSGKKATRFIGTVLDISMEKSLELSTRELLLKKDEFISIASHELKTPVTSLKLSLQLLNKMKDNPSVAMFPKLIDQSNKSMEKITNLIDDLLNVTRMNEGQLTLNKTSFNVTSMLNGCCSHIRDGNNYEIVVQGDEHLQIFADEHRLEQVVVNFVNNAIKYAPDSKVIYLLIEKEDNLVKISVKDNGPGIPPEQLTHLFDRYYRSDYQGKQYSGLGLGLYISAEIIKRHEGEIGVDSVVGKGSTFWFKIPALFLSFAI